MLGRFQKSCLRIELEASQEIIGKSLMERDRFQEWLFPQGLLPQSLTPDFPETLTSGSTFTAQLGPITINHKVDVATPETLRLLLSGSIDGYHEWYWGEGWVQSRLEGVTLFPLSFAHTLALLRLRDFVKHQEN